MHDNPCNFRKASPHVERVRTLWGVEPQPAIRSQGYRTGGGSRYNRNGDDDVQHRAGFRIYQTLQERRPVR